MERDGPVRTVTLTRSEKRNALDSAMLDALLQAFTEQPEQADRVIVLRAEGPVFCAGMDLAERLAKPVTKGASPIEVVLEAIEHHPLPVVGVVQGDAIAGGNELALHCDFVVAGANARFGMSLAQIGLAPTWFLAKKLIEVAGPVASREMSFDVSLVTDLAAASAMGPAAVNSSAPTFSQPGASASPLISASALSRSGTSSATAR